MKTSIDIIADSMMKNSIDIIDIITKLYGGQNPAELHEILHQLRIVIKTELLDEVLNAIKTVDTFYK